jgi:hypothetical protein
MQKMKKSQIFMLKYLFGIIIALMFFIPTVQLAAKYFKFVDKPKDSFEQLSSIIDSIEEGSLISMPLHMDQEYLIVGFSKNSKSVETVIYNVRPFNPTIKSIKRPFQCEKDKSCICLCKEGIKHKSSEIICTEEIQCNNFEDTDFFEKRPVGEVPLKKNKLSKETEWRNGFFISNSDDTTLLKNLYLFDTMLPTSRIPSPSTIYTQRHKGFVNVCFSSDCITDGMIDELNKDDAIKEFNRFEEFYLGCKDLGECKGFTLTLPKNYYVYYKQRQKGLGLSRKEIPGIFYLIKTKDATLKFVNANFGYLILEDEKEEEIKFEDNLYTPDKKDHVSDLVDEGFDLDLKMEEGQVIAIFYNYLARLES